ncbi:MAG: hypothetical protein V1777_02285 [Candidatus Micrarchaeota archaeon]
MPRKSLSPALIARLKRMSPVIDRFLGKMKNIDTRRHLQSIQDLTDPEWGTIHLLPTDTQYPSRRVRQMNISRNYPSTSLVIKRADNASAQEVIDFVKQKVRKHNKKFGTKDYILLEPRAYAISQDLIAMAKTRAPNVADILYGGEGTGAATLFFDNLCKKNQSRISKKNLSQVTGTISRRTNWARHNILLLGFSKGKFVFMPLVDKE